MSEMFLGLICLLTFLGFSIYGFISFLVYVSNKSNEPKKLHPQQPLPNFPRRHATLNEDITGTSRLLNYLLVCKLISFQKYNSIRYILEKVANGVELEARITDLSHLTPEDANSPAVETGDSIDKVSEFEDEIRVLSSSLEATPIEVTEHSKLEKLGSITIEDAPESIESHDKESTLATADAWQSQPELSPSPPKRTFNEMLAAFMLDKNIRWGELASGILIVGSAVGLVVSLRNELQDSIPYFSALMFLLITAAIHAAGIYTAKKWKLRNTSRGTLLIGLLLIPLNFLAACILSNQQVEQRELTDPYLWTAIIVGLISFGMMTWYSGKCLLRKGQWPLMFSILGSAAGTLLINRAEGIDESTLVKLGLMVPLILSFMAGSLLAFKQQWYRKHWRRRAIFRLLIFSGISFFAFLAGSALLVIRAEHNPPTWVSMAPAFAIVALVGSWIGHTIWKGAIGPEAKPLQLTGLSMTVLSLTVVCVTWLISFSNPMILVITSTILVIGFFGLANQRDESSFLVAGWVAFASLVLCGVNLIAGVLPWNSWTDLAQLKQVAISGRSGISLFAVGAIIMIVHRFLIPQKFNTTRLRLAGLASGSLTAMSGLALAIAASFVNRDHFFDNMAASCLLGLMALTVFGFSIRSGKSRQSKLIPGRWLSSIANTSAVLSFSALAHAFIWNPTIATWLSQTLHVEANWQIVLTAHVLLLGLLAGIVNWQKRTPDSWANDRTDIITNCLSVSAFVVGLIAVVTIMMLPTVQSAPPGLATVLLVSLCAASWIFAWCRYNADALPNWSIVLTLLTGLTVGAAMLDLVTLQEWCPGPKHPRHWLLQITALSAWFTVWFMVSEFFSRWRRLSFIAIPRPLTISISIALAVVFTGLIGSTLLMESNLELFKVAAAPLFSITQQKVWAFVALATVAAMLAVATFKEPSGYLGAAIVVVWTVGWGIGSLYFVEQKAVATALRWLLPIGGAIGACLVASRKPAVTTWVVARNKLGMSGRSVWSKTITQNLINLSLGIVVLVSMLIATVAIVQFLMFGGVEALGGPLKQTLFGDMKKDISYGLPIGIIVNTFLLYAISERRKWLATAGSLVFQYCVLLSVVLLAVSPHPKLASSWFVNILQAVSIGMTGYGFVWWYFRQRIESGVESQLKSAIDFKPKKRSQLKIHTFINGILISSLAVLVMSRFFRFPMVPGDWINTVGGPLGIGAWATFAVLAYLVWKTTLQKAHRTSSWMWLICWSGLVLIGMLAALFDRSIADQETYPTFLTFNLIMWGTIAVGVVQVGMLWLERRPESSPSDKSSALKSNRLGLRIKQSAEKSIRDEQTLPLLFACLVTCCFTTRGMEFIENFWPCYIASFCVIGLLFCGACLRQSGYLGFVTATMTAWSTFIFVIQDPANWFDDSRGPHLANVLGIALVSLAMLWTGYFIWKTVWRQQAFNPRFMWMPNSVLILSAIWLFWGSMMQWVVEVANVRSVSFLANVWGITLFAGTITLAAMHLFNRERKGLVVASCWLWFASVIFAVCLLIEETTDRQLSAIIASLGFAVGVLGLVWRYRGFWVGGLRKLQAPRLGKLQKSMRHQLPTFGCLFGLLVVLVSYSSLTNASLDNRLDRYLLSISPFGLAVGFACWSDLKRGRWVQIVSLAMLTLGAVFVAWADLNATEMRNSSVFVRTLLVLATAMYVYGAGISRWVQQGNTWLKSLREMSVITCGLALATLVVVVGAELHDFVPDEGCGRGILESLSVAIAVAAMAVGLVVIAVRKRNDPFGLSLRGRMAYVYVAQLVGGLLLVHMYLTMPYLFRLGIKEYWPYIVMLLCFGGIGLSNWLEQRNLTVLGEPLFNTAALVPLAVAYGIWVVDSQADHSVVTLVVGLIYLLICYQHRSTISAVAAILFGNLALWLFYDKFSWLSFYVHPQLWLIPPAVSVLIAAQISKDKWTKSQLALIRYVCATTIYLASTSEIFISGLGTRLWPPMILALLSVGGIFAGILLQIRAYLYLGAVFLIMAMISMVSHAHRSLDHVWPWWVFGISLGIAILVMFGMFEKKKNDMRQVVHRLKQWDL